MKCNVIAQSIYEKKIIKSNFTIDFESYEEVIFISLHELKLILLEKLNYEKGNLSVIPYKISLNTKNNIINIIVKCKPFSDWDIIKNYNTFSK